MEKVKQSMVIGIVFLTALCSSAQTPKSPGAGSQSGSSGASLQGLSYDQLDWKNDLKLPKLRENKRIVACFQLHNAGNTAQPFVLVPIHPTSYKDINPIAPFIQSCTTPPNEQDKAMNKWCGKHQQGSWSPCSLVDEKHPIMMGQTLVIGIDTGGVSIDRLKVLNLNVTTAQSNPINPTPVRTSASVGGSTVSLGGQYYMTWPNPLPGDVIPTVSVNAVYTPPIAGEQWSKLTYYATGSVITSTDRNGHYYMAIAGDVSGSMEPKWSSGLPVAVTDGDIIWVDSGMASLAVGVKTLQIWLPTHPYNQGDTILNPYNAHVYVSISPNGTMSGGLPDNPLSLPILSAKATQVASAPAEIKDGPVIWQAKTCNANAKPWKANTEFKDTEMVGPYNGTCYQPATTGVTGNKPTQPYFPSGTAIRIKDVNLGSNSLEWVDVGVLPPSSVTGTPAADQTVGLLNFQFGQTHTKSYYNLASGVVYSTVHSRTFGIPPNTTSTSGQVQTSSNPTFDPVLFFTAYPWPADTEQHCSFPRCLWQTKPGVSFGMSLTSPSSSFYAGGSFELIRNIQAVIGNNWAKQARLPNPSVNIASNATTATTVQRFSNGAYYGLTFNISGFVQSLFGGGGGASSKSSTQSQ
jgi:hypothetical protein